MIKISGSYIEFTAFGAYTDEFINEIMGAGMRISEISCENSIHTIRIRPCDYLSAARTARKFRVKTKVVKRAGGYFALRRYKKRLGIPAGILAFCAVIVFLSSFIWDIQVSGNSEIQTWQILEQLSSMGIYPGAKIGSYNANIAELELQMTFDKLAWVSIERTGSRINVKVSERLESEQVTQKEISVSEPCNIVSSRTGQLIRADVFRGKLMYKEGSGIRAGDVIVSGVVKDGLDEETATSQSYVHAQAVLIVQVEEYADFYLPYTFTQKSKNGRSVNNKSVVFLGKRFGGEFKIDKNADYVHYNESIKKPAIFGFPLPLKIIEQDYIFYDKIQVTDSYSSVFSELERQIELYEKNFLVSKGAQIIEKNEEFYPDDNGLGVLVRYVYQIDAAEKQEMTVG
jgi:similar to stage IV sporulation protein